MPTYLAFTVYKKEMHLYTLIILYVLIKTNNNASGWFRKVGFCDWKKPYYS